MPNPKTPENSLPSESENGEEEPALTAEDYVLIRRHLIVQLRQLLYAYQYEGKGETVRFQRKELRRTFSVIDENLAHLSTDERNVEIVRKLVEATDQLPHVRQRAYLSVLPLIADHYEDQ